jgi:hypothetical protein
MIGVGFGRCACVVSTCGLSVPNFSSALMLHCYAYSVACLLRFPHGKFDRHR